MTVTIDLVTSVHAQSVLRCIDENTPYGFMNVFCSPDDVTGLSSSVIVKLTVFTPVTLFHTEICSNTINGLNCVYSLRKHIPIKVMS